MLRREAARSAPGGTARGRAGAYRERTSLPWGLTPLCSDCLVKQILQITTIQEWRIHREQRSHFCVDAFKARMALRIAVYTTIRREHMCHAHTPTMAGTYQFSIIEDVAF